MERPLKTFVGRDDVPGYGVIASPCSDGSCVLVYLQRMCGRRVAMSCAGDSYKLSGVYGL